MDGGKRALLAILMLGVVSCLLFAPLQAQRTTTEDPFVAVVVKVTQPVLIQRANADNLIPLKQDDRLYPGDRIVCGEGGRASIIFADTAVEIKLLPDTEVTFQGQRTNGGVVKRLFLQLGNLLTHVLRGEMEVVTPSCIASVKGTQWWTTVNRAAQTLVVVLEGNVEVQNRASGATELVGAGNTATSTPDGQLLIESTTNSDLPADSTGQQPGSLEIEFEDESGQSKTLHIEFDR